MLRSSNSFHCLNSGQQNELMRKHKFPEADSINFSTTSAHDILGECLKEDNMAKKDAAQHAADSKSFGDLSISSTRLRREQPTDAASQPSDSSSTPVENDVRQCSIAHNKLQAQSPRHLDLQRQVSELKASNADLKELLSCN